MAGPTRLSFSPIAYDDPPFLSCTYTAQQEVGTITGNGTLQHPLEIKLTPLYAAAPDLFKALDELVKAIELAAANGLDTTGHLGVGDAFAALRRAQGRD